MTAWDKGACGLFEPGEGETYWQPQPTGGYVTLTMTPEQFELFQISRRRPLTLDERAAQARVMKDVARRMREGDFGRLEIRGQEMNDELTFVPISEVLARMAFSRGPARAVPAGTVMPFPGHRFLELADRMRRFESDVAIVYQQGYDDDPE